MSQSSPSHTDFRGFPSGDPEGNGVSSEKLAAIDAFYREKCASRKMSGIVYAIARHGKLVHAAALGFADIEGRRAMALDTVFRLYSMTKPLTAVALMMLHEEGWFELDDPVAKYLPEFANIEVFPTTEFFFESESETVDLEPAGHDMTIRDVLRHTAGFGLGFGMGGRAEQVLARCELYQPHENLADQLARVAKVPLASQPGALFNYSLGPDVQARLVEVFSGSDFASFLRTRLLDPLAMSDTAFVPRPDMVARLTKLYWWNGEALSPWSAENLPPLPPNAKAWPKSLVNLADPSLTYVRGSFGLYSTTLDYLRFAQMLLNGGALDGVRILSAATIKLMASDQLGDIPMMWPVQGLGFGLGFAVIKDPAKTGAAGTAGTFYWDGAAGTIFWVDPDRDLVVVALVQHLLTPGLDPHALAAEMHNHVYPALTD